MIKKQCHIKQFSPEERRALEAIAAKTGIKTARGLLIHALMHYNEATQDKDRALRLLEMKKKQLTDLKDSLEWQDPTLKE